MTASGPASLNDLAKKSLVEAHDESNEKELDLHRRNANKLTAEVRHTYLDRISTWNIYSECTHTAVDNLLSLLLV